MPLYPCTLNHASIPLHLNHTLPLHLAHASRSTYTRIPLHNNIPTWICISFDMDTPLFWHGYTSLLTWIHRYFDMDIPLFWHRYTSLLTWIYLYFDMDTPVFWHGYTSLWTWIHQNIPPEKTSIHVYCNITIHPCTVAMPRAAQISANSYMCHDSFTSVTWRLDYTVCVLAYVCVCVCVCVCVYVCTPAL